VSGSVREVAEAVRKKACALGTKNHGQCIKAVNQTARWLIIRLEEADLSGGSSERLAEAMVPWGAEGDIRERVREHYGHLIRVTRSDRASLNS